MKRLFAAPARLARRAAIAAAVLPVLLAAGVLVPRGATSAEAGPRRDVLLVANPIHTDIALPVDEVLLRRFAFLAEDGLPVRHPGVRFIVFGWGSREFYLRTPTWDALEWGAVARAVTLDASVMHVSLGGAIDAAGPGVMTLRLGSGQYGRLLDAIAAGFTPGAGPGAPAIAGPAYGRYDRFYEANGRFNAALGCNTWTAAVLREAGVATGFWTPMPKLLFWSLALHARSALAATAAPTGQARQP